MSHPILQSTANGEVSAPALAAGTPSSLPSAGRPRRPAGELPGRTLVGAGLVAAVVVHSATDLVEWLGGGFVPWQLWANYLAFLPMPALMFGLAAAQRPRIGWAGWVGALLYGSCFVYFAHTTLVAIEDSMSSYQQLWHRLGPTYTGHGLAMIAGGLLFGKASLDAGCVPRWAALLFLGGIALHLAIAIAGLPAEAHGLPTAVRNLGLAGMGWALCEAGGPARAEGSIT